MNSWWSILIGLVVLTVGGLPDSVLASDRNGMAWQKSTNFNNHQNRQILVKMKRTKPATQVARFSSTRKKPEPPAYRILATFQLDQDALALAPAQEPVAPAKPVPGKCEWVRSIVVGYAFEDVAPKVCTGSVFTYGARRGGRSYIVQASSLTGELVKVERTDALPESTTVTIAPANQ